MTIIQARLEDSPPVPWQGLIPCDEAQAGLVRDACHALDAYLARHGGNIPLWEYAAFWWAVATVTAGISVADLAKGLDAWHERFVSALFWWEHHGKGQERPKGKTPQDTLAIMRYWAYYADLRHGRAIRHLEEKGIPRNVILDGFRKVVSLGSYALPSSLQEWGNGYERYLELLEQV